MSKNSNNGSNSSGSAPDNDSGLGLQEIIQMGEAASQALNNPIYQIAHKGAVDQAILEWSETSPKEREKRESLWHEVQAHGRAAQIMRGCIERAQQLMQEQNASQTQNDYLSNQGFGLEDEVRQGDAYQ